MLRFRLGWINFLLALVAAELGILIWHFILR
jgi:hypothetical protein